jgi:putative transposase
MKYHLGYDKHAIEGNNSGNSHNGKSKKTIRTENESFEIEVPRDRDREGEFESQFVKKHQRCVNKFNDMVISLYARGQLDRFATKWNGQYPTIIKSWYEN